LEGDGPVESSCVEGSPSSKVGPQDFEILRVVGQGAFGKVELFWAGQSTNSCSYELCACSAANCWIIAHAMWCY
jgi:hypothetical protein